MWQKQNNFSDFPDQMNLLNIRATKGNAPHRIEPTAALQARTKPNASWSTGCKFKNKLFHGEVRCVRCFAIEDVTVYPTDIHQGIKKWKPPLS